MHIQLLTLIDRKMENAMIRLSQLPIPAIIYHHQLEDRILHITKLQVHTYTAFFKSLKILSGEYKDNYKRHLLIRHTVEGSPQVEKVIDESVLFALTHTISPYLKDRQNPQKRTVPIHIHHATRSHLSLFTGITLVDAQAFGAVSILHEFSIPLRFINFEKVSSEYLVNMLEQYKALENVPLKAFVNQFGISYKQFQRDSKVCFGTTFYNFIIQLKMLDVIGDLMFTDLSFKEIAFKHDFSGYSNMYRQFNNRYDFSLRKIPRFLDII